MSQVALHACHLHQVVCRPSPCHRPPISNRVAHAGTKAALETRQQGVRPPTLPLRRPPLPGVATVLGSSAEVAEALGRSLAPIAAAETDTPASLTKCRRSTLHLTSRSRDVTLCDTSDAGCQRRWTRPDPPRAAAPTLFRYQPRAEATLPFPGRSGLSIAMSESAAAVRLIERQADGQMAPGGSVATL